VTEMSDTVHSWHRHALVLMHVSATDSCAAAEEENDDDAATPEANLPGLSAPRLTFPWNTGVLRCGGGSAAS